MRIGFVAVAAASLTLIGLNQTALASTTEVWSFDVSTTGDDTFWSSMTAVKPAADRFDWTVEITRVEATVFFGIEIGPLDVTDQVPPELLITSGSADGPAPTVIDEGPIVAPEPPEPPAVSMQLAVTIDASGFGQVAATDITLGTVTVDLGFPLGVQTVPIVGVGMQGNVDITPVCVADLDGSGDVGAADLAQLIGFWGSAEPSADLDGDGVVGAADLATLIGFWGPCF